jgi:dTDP-4-dehydrorhamnose 3,5-epimerase
MIEGVVVSPRRQILDERGKVMRMLRCDDPEFEQFGEVYFSVVFPGVVKGWHLHTRMTLNYAVVSGLIKLVLYDNREGSATQGRVDELYVGESNYVLVKVPAGVWNGFKGLGTSPSIVANCATLPHDPEEIQRIDPTDPRIPYDWAIRHR